MPIYDPANINDPEAQWLRLRDSLPADAQKSLEASYHLAARVHSDQYRRVSDGSGRVPYIVHPLRVACILVEEWECLDPKVLSTCLLHDTLEDCAPNLFNVLPKEIERLEGREVFDAVQMLTKPNLPEPCPPDVKAARDARYFKVLFQGPAWVRMVKCADRVDNLRDARAWGHRSFWERYSSETIGWHLYLARETAPITEVALFKALVEGERAIRGRVPVWADGHLIDPLAAAQIPEHIARNYGAVGLALRGPTFLLGLTNPGDKNALAALSSIINQENETKRELEVIPITQEALDDALAAGLYGSIEPLSPE